MGGLMISTSHYVCPPSVDLVPQIDEVEDQGALNSCTGNAGAKMLEILADRMYQDSPDRFQSVEFSRLYIYYWERNFEARRGQEGAYMSSLMEVLQNKGCCPESLWGYDSFRQNLQPPANCDVEAQKYKVLDYQLLTDFPALERPQYADRIINTMKHALAQGRPLVMGMNLSQDFMGKVKDQKDWKQSLWNPQGDSAGGHAVTVVGYDDQVQRFLIQNSWGPEWGDGGFFGLPYEFMASSYTTQTVYAPLRINFGPLIPAPGYTRIQFDPERARLIREFLGTQMRPIFDAADKYLVSDAEIELAMGYKEGSWSKIKF